MGYNERSGGHLISLARSELRHCWLIIFTNRYDQMIGREKVKVEGGLGWEGRAIRCLGKITCDLVCRVKGI